MTQQLSAPLRASLVAALSRHKPDIDRATAARETATAAATAAVSAFTAHQAATSRATVRIGPAPAALDSGPVLASVAVATGDALTAYSRLTADLVKWAQGACDGIDAAGDSYTAALARADAEIAALKVELATATKPYTTPNQYGRRP